MNKFQRDSLKLRLLRLAMSKSTGAPSELALRFEVSVRSIKRLVKEIREDGNEIRYSRSRSSYVTDRDYE